LHASVLAQLDPLFNVPPDDELLLIHVEDSLRFILVVHIFHDLHQTVFRHNRSLAAAKCLFLAHIIVGFFKRLALLLKRLDYLLLLFEGRWDLIWHRWVVALVLQVVSESLKHAHELFSTVFTFLETIASFVNDVIGEKSIDFESFEAVFFD